MPLDVTRRAEWQQRAGVVAAHREAVGWSDEHQALGTMPGLTSTEKRASYTAAWHALGRPPERLTEAAMTDGQLRVRVRAAKAEEAWAPPHVDDALRHAEDAAEQARQAAVLADAHADRATKAGDHHTADRLRQEAAEHRDQHAMHAQAAAHLTTGAEARGMWAASAALTLDHGRRADAELKARGIAWGQEPDRTTAEEWLAADCEARVTDDEHRTITETDLLNDGATEAAAAVDANLTSRRRSSRTRAAHEPRTSWTSSRARPSWTRP